MDNFTAPQPQPRPTPEQPTQVSDSSGFTQNEKQLLLDVARRLDKELTMKRWTRIAMVGLVLVGILMFVILWLTLGQSLIDGFDSAVIS